MTGHPGVVNPQHCDDEVDKEVVYPQHSQNCDYKVDKKNRFIPNIDNIVTASGSRTHSRWRRGLKPSSGGLRELIPEDCYAFHLEVFMSERGGLVYVHTGAVLVRFVTVNNPNRKQMEVVGQEGGENIPKMYEQIHVF